MTIYARSDLQSVTHPTTGQTFTRTHADEFAIDSDEVHEAFLLASPSDVYSRTREGVPPTPDEIADMAHHEREATVRTHLAAAEAAGVLNESRGRIDRARWTQ